ncbi:glycosyltransferase family 39 protein [Streptosporangium sp. NPDC048047]|uniref:glycosyltransferase family 39 protein n=1 Tax=Streptosporangium sp. NPDC048047 TaxID=3155748 RepID=UPI0034365D29
MPETPRFARVPVVVTALAVSAVLLAVSPRYGYHRDELYFRLLGEHPALGYFDTPPLTPMIARVSIGLFGDGVTSLRVLPALVAALVVVLTALLSRELGGGRTAQVLAAAGVATATMVLVAGHTLLTLSIDLPLWVAAALFCVRALRGDGRWWLAVGAVAGVATYNRQLVVLLLAAVGVGVLAAGPRDVLRDRRIWFGALLALALAAPNLVYQATHGWPQVQMAAALEADDGAENRVMFVPLQALLLGPVQAVLQVAGAVRLWREPRLRCLVLAYAVACALMLYSGGRADYVVGMLVLLFAAGCGPAERWMSGAGRTAEHPARRPSERTAGRARRPSERAAGQTAGQAGRPSGRAGRRALLGGFLAAGALVSAVVALPVVPPASLEGSPVAAMNEVARESVGWPEFAARVAAVVRDLPPADRARAVLLTENYGEAGVLARYARQYGLPAVYSGHNELYRYGPPPASARVAVVVTDAPVRYGRSFASCERRGRIDNGVGLSNEEQHLPILVCHDPAAPWDRLWPRFRHYS